jgi:uncharacterized integral membrane protein
MKSFKTLLIWLIVLIAIGLGVWLSIDNPQSVILILFGLDLPQMSLGVIVLGALLLGAVSGFFVSLMPMLKISSQNASLQRKLKRRDKELVRFRKAPLIESLKDK